MTAGRNFGHLLPTYSDWTAWRRTVTCMRLGYWRDTFNPLVVAS